MANAVKISEREMGAAVSKGLITQEQANALWNCWKSEGTVQARFDFAHVAYYFGALVVISAMAWFMTTAWESLGGMGILGLAVVYATIFVLAGRTLWSEKGLKIPGGLLITVAVCMAPLAIFGVEKATGFWPQGDPGHYRDYHVWVKGSWFFMELGTIVGGLVALKYFRFPFLTAPIAFSLWYMSMDLTPLLFGKVDFVWNERLWVSLWFGLAVLLVSFLIDRKTNEDFAFWGYLFGMFAFWGGMSMLNSQSELNKFFYLLINLGLIVVSVILDRRVFIIFGSLGVFGYLGHLAYQVFKDSLLFPIAVSFLGILILWLGVQYQRKRERFEKALVAILPAGLQRFRGPGG